MKLDKETLIKERFWFLLPVIALFLLISWICILMVRSETAKNYIAASNQNKELKTIAITKDLKNPPWIEAMHKELLVSDAKKDELWYKEYNRQNQAIREKDPLQGKLIKRLNPFMTCPDKMREKWEQLHPGEKLNEMDFGQNLGNIPQDEFRVEYIQQYRDIVGVIHDWLNETNPNKIEGAVRVGGGSGNHADAAYTNLVQPIRLTDKLILSDEAWLIEEDIAVKREIFQSLADLLDSYSRLKPEWSEVSWSEIKVVAPPAASAPAGETTASGTPTSPALTNPPTTAVSNGHSVPAANAQEQEPEVYQRVRFYNYIWPNLLDGQQIAQDDKLRNSLTQYGLPTVEPYKGWRLDLTVMRDPRDEKKLILRGTSANHSDKFKLPALSLAVWFASADNPAKEMPQPLILTDAGNVDPCEYWPRGGLKKLSEKKLQDLSIPPGYGINIKRVSRVLPENAIAQQVCFNHDWLVNVRLVQQPNRPNSLNLVGEVINRSGRRMPGAFFTAGLSQANSNTPLLEEFNVATDAFNAGERKPFFKEIRFPVPPRGLDFVTQKLTWRSTPIKRIDRLEIGRLAHSQSDRLKVLPLKTYDFKKKEVVAATPAQPATPDTATTPPAPIEGAIIPGGSAPSGTAELHSPNQGIPLDRYTEVTTQLRRIPVALVMTVDATAMADIIGAMSNSRLRFQVTMAPWTRVQNLGRPGGGGTAAATTAPGAGYKAMGPTNVPGGRGNPANPPDDAIGAAGGGGQTKAAAPVQPSRPGAAPGAAPAAAGQFGLEDDSSVVELQIYGIITIYESPDAQKKATSGTVAAADTGAIAPK